MNNKSKLKNAITFIDDLRRLLKKKYNQAINDEFTVDNFYSKNHFTTKLMIDVAKEKRVDVLSRYETDDDEVNKQLARYYDDKLIDNLESYLIKFTF